MDEYDSETEPRQRIPLDSALPDWLKELPDQSRPYAALARWDRPVGIWLLLLPCWIGLALMRVPAGFQWIDLVWILLFAIGAIAMRGAGCTWNDIRDRDVDAALAATEARVAPHTHLLFVRVDLRHPRLERFVEVARAALGAVAAFADVDEFRFAHRVISGT